MVRSSKRSVLPCLGQYGSGVLPEGGCRLLGPKVWGYLLEPIAGVRLPAGRKLIPQCLARWPPATTARSGQDGERGDTRCQAGLGATWLRTGDGRERPRGPRSGLLPYSVSLGTLIFASEGSEGFLALLSAATGGVRGSRTEKVAPSSPDATSTDPPCASAISFVM